MSMMREFWLAGALVCLMPICAAADGGDWRRAPLIQEIRAATSVYRDVQAAEAAGYVATACAAGGTSGAMGIHYVHPGLLFNADGTPNGEFDVATPEVLVYEPLRDGGLSLVAVEYIAFAQAWDAAHPGGESPVLRGQLFHLAGAPNRYRLPAFYQLHVWAWKKNPNGSFADWNPLVSCEPYDPA